MSLSRDDFSLPPAWRPNPGDIVEGTVDRIESILGGAYEPYWALVLKLDGERALRVSVSGEIENRHVEAVALHAFHLVLKNELARVDAQVGDRLGVLYEGEVEGGQGNSYHRWSVRKQGGVQPTVSWNRTPGEPVPATPATDVPGDARGLMAPLPHEQQTIADAAVVDESPGSSPRAHAREDDEVLPFRRLPVPELDVAAPARPRFRGRGA